MYCSPSRPMLFSVETYPSYAPCSDLISLYVSTVAFYDLSSCPATRVSCPSLSPFPRSHAYASASPAQVVLWWVYAVLAAMRVVRPRPPLVVHPAMLGRSRMPRLGLDDVVMYAVECLVAVVRRGVARRTDRAGDSGGGRQVVGRRTSVAAWTVLLLAVLVAQVRMWRSGDGAREVA